MQRAAKFKSKKESLKEMFAAMGVTKTGKELYHLTVGYMQTLFEDLAPFIALKAAAMDAMAADAAEATRLKEMLKQEKDPHAMRELLEKMNALAVRDDTAAFRKHPEQHSMVRAAAYTDELSSHRDGRSCRFYFVCLAGGTEYPCLRMMASKTWKRRFETEAWVAKQRWQCPCGANYRPKFGTLIEVHDPARACTYYWRGSCPDWDTLDTLALRAEHRLAAGTPLELFNAIPSCVPTTTTVVTPAEEPGVFRVCSVAFLDSLPMWEWEDMYTFAQRVLP